MRDPLEQRAAAALGTAVRRSERVAGGSINQARHLWLEDGREVFLKHRDPAPAGMFAAEAESLRWIARSETIRVPGVHAVDDAYLALEWIEPGPPMAGHDEALGRGLAALHRSGAPRFGQPWDGPGFIGPIPFPAGWFDDWPTCLAESRLLPLGRMARDAAVIGEADARALERLCARLKEWYPADVPPARLHGDLWSGNRHRDESGAPVLIDPCASGGNREIDLAMMHLFGGFSARVFDAYDDAWPVDQGEPDRRDLNQLVPLLVHAVLFGGGYVDRALAIVRRRVGVRGADG